jgi:hypothetical protein
MAAQQTQNDVIRKLEAQIEALTNQLQAKAYSVSAFKAPNGEYHAMVHVGRKKISIAKIREIRKFTDAQVDAFEAEGIRKIAEKKQADVATAGSADNERVADLQKQAAALLAQAKA